jgi:uncharacterized delta-60 repeat protein
MKRLIALGAVVSCVLFAPSASAVSADGFYDNTFSGDGRQLIDVSSSTSDNGRVLRILTGGKLLMGGTCVTGATNYFCITRLDANGNKDLAFGPDNTGTITFDRFFGDGYPTNDSLGDMLSLSDGRILILGVGTLAMLNAGGTALDTGSAGGAGYVGVFGKYALAEQTDHKILVAGYAPRGDGYLDMAVQRFLPDLTPDPDFGTNGSASIIFNLGQASSIANSVAVQSNGNIVIAGYVAFTAQPGKSVGIARMLPNGQPDPAFNGWGVGWTYQTPYGTEDVALSVRLDQKGRIVYAGYGATDTNFGTRRCVINRLLANGSQDFSFNGNQPLVFLGLVGATNTPCELVDVAPQSDGTVLAVGSLADVYFTAIRLTPAGTFDSTFGASGMSVGAFDPGATSSVVRSGATAVGNGLLVAGTYKGADTRFGIAQLTLTVHIFANGFEN